MAGRARRRDLHRQRGDAEHREPTITFSATDTSGNTGSDTKTVTVQATNQTPVLATTTTTAPTYRLGATGAVITGTDQTPIVTGAASSGSYVSKSAASVIDGALTVSDRDDPTLVSASVSITGGLQTGDALGLSNLSGAYGTITAAPRVTGYARSDGNGGTLITAASVSSSLYRFFDKADGSHRQRRRARQPDREPAGLVLRAAGDVL